MVTSAQHIQLLFAADWRAHFECECRIGVAVLVADLDRYRLSMHLIFFILPIWKQRSCWFVLISPELVINQCPAGDIFSSCHTSSLYMSHNLRGVLGLDHKYVRCWEKPLQMVLYWCFTVIVCVIFMKFQMAHLATTYAAVNSLVTIGGEKALVSINRYRRLFQTSKASRD